MWPRKASAARLTKAARPFRKTTTPVCVRGDGSLVKRCSVKAQARCGGEAVNDRSFIGSEIALGSRPMHTESGDRLPGDGRQDAGGARIRDRVHEGGVLTAVEFVVAGDFGEQNGAIEQRWSGSANDKGIHRRIVFEIALHVGWAAIEALSAPQFQRGGVDRDQHPTRKRDQAA